VVLTGPPGAGKTQLAAAYARARLASGWRLVVWINARDHQSLVAGLAGAARTAALPDADAGQGPAAAAQALRRWLEADGSHCLLVFDDVADLALLRPFVPDAGAAKILAIPVAEPTAELGTRVPVEVFSAEEAMALLAGRTGLASEAGAPALAAEMGYLPLGLDQAAALIATQRLEYAEYLARLRALPSEDYPVRTRDGEEEQPYPPGVARAVLLSMEAAAAADPLGVCAATMEVMAMLAPAAIRRDLLHAAGQAGLLLGRGRRVGAPMVDQALERLNEWSLLSLSLDGQVVTMHGLVARLVRAWLSRRGRLAAAGLAAAAALAGAAESLAKPDHLAVSSVLGQVTALLANAAGLADDPGEELNRRLTRLRFLVLDRLIELGDSLPEAITMGEPLLADLKQVLGPSHPDTRNARTSLANAYHAAGRVAEAIPLLRESLADHELVFGADHPSTLASRNNLASAYRATGQPAEAIPLFEENVAACGRLLGADHPKTQASRHRLALAREEAGQPGG